MIAKTNSLTLRHAPDPKFAGMAFFGVTHTLLNNQPLFAALVQIRLPDLPELLHFSEEWSDRSQKH
jgi:hypothetical protein